MKRLLIGVLLLTLMAPQGAVLAATKSTSKSCSKQEKVLAKLEKKENSIEKKYDKKIAKAKKSNKDYERIDREKLRKLADLALDQISAQNSYNSCLGIHIPSSGVDSQASALPTALCRDMTYSYSLTRSGTCSWHGGVAVWLQP